MKSIIGLGACISILAMAGAAHAQQAADPVTAQFLCDMTGDCDAGEATATSAAPEAAVPATSGPRRSSTRGFTFNRANANAPAAQAPSRPVQVASVAPVQRPAKVGSTDLRLSFVSGSAILTDPAKDRLAKYAAALANPRLASRRVRIEGYTDASGNARSNLTLSQRRAQAVADYLVAAGLPSRRFEVIGYGATKLLPGVAPQSADNRRVLAVLL